MIIGVLALQGDFAKHEEMLVSMGISVKLVRTKDHLEGCDGLIIPGGESTVILRLLEFTHLKNALQIFAEKKPVFGTCAGLILMSKEIEDSSLRPLSLLKCTVKRNAFGRQANSFEAPISLSLPSSVQSAYPAFFIRAPRIESTEEGVKILGEWEKEPVLVQQGMHLGATFHPELTNNCIIHHYFIELVRASHS